MAFCWHFLPHVEGNGLGAGAELDSIPCGRYATNPEALTSLRALMERSIKWVMFGISGKLLLALASSLYVYRPMEKTLMCFSGGGGG